MIASIALCGKYGVGHCAVVDASMFASLSQHRWYANRPYPDGYAIARIDGRTVQMHRLVVGVGNIPAGYVVHHVNRDRLDNRRCNLRAVTVAENNRNSVGPFNPDYQPTTADIARWTHKARMTRQRNRQRSSKQTDIARPGTVTAQPAALTRLEIAAATVERLHREQDARLREWHALITRTRTSVLPPQGTLSPALSVGYVAWRSRG